MSKNVCSLVTGTLVAVFAITSAHAQAVPGGPAKAGSSAAPQTTVTSAASAKPADENVDPTRKLFEDGTADLNAGKFSEAAEKLRQVWSQKKSYDVAGNLGAALLKLGEHAEAAMLLHHAIAAYPAGGKPSVKKWLDELLAEAKAKVAEVRLTVTGDAPTRTVRVDGKPIDSELVGSSVFVAPGHRVIEVSAKGFQTARETIEAKEGQALDVTLSLVPEAQPQRSMLWPTVAFGAGGVGLLLGAITGGIAAAQMDSVRAKCDPELKCPENLRGDVESATTVSRVSTAGFVLAGVGAAVGVTLLFVPLGEKPKPQGAKGNGGAAKPQAGLVFGPAFIGVKGAF